MNHDTTKSGDFDAPGRAAGPAARPGDRPAADDALWTVRDVSRYLRIPVSSIYKMTARQAAVRIPHIHIGNALRFRKVNVDQWLALLTTSNMDALAKARRKGQQAAHGPHSQANP